MKTKTKNWLSSGNAKLKKSGIYSWGIPAYKSASGKLVCPAAKDCLQGCYARNGFYVMPSVKKAQEERLALSQRGMIFAVEISEEIKRRGVKTLRIHDSGDFYSKRYLDSWLAVIQMNPSVRFYAYTKMIPLFRGLTLPSNFTVIFSYGGKFDSMIKPETDRHSAVFPSLSALKAAGYADTTTYDHNAFGANHRVGLVYHGAKSKAWEAVAA
jgi:hypothetical protein